MQTARKGSRSEPRNRLGRLWLWLLVPVLLFVGMLTLALASPPTVVLSVGGKVLGENLGPTEAEHLLREYYNQLLTQQVTLTAGEMTAAFSRQELGLALAVEREVQRFSAEVERAAWYSRLPGYRYHAALPLDLHWDEWHFNLATGALQAATLRAPIPASMDVIDDVPTITPELPGSRLSIPQALGALREAGLSTQVSLPVEEVVPEVTAETLTQLGIRRLIAEWTTEYDPTIPRAENVERAAESFDGLMVKPGETISYNETVGPITSETGWREAFVIVGGKLVPGIGGGVCQVATTFYGAALRANLEIVERHPHHLAVSYIAPSQDAAIAQGWEDLQIRNTTGGHLLIHTMAEGGRVTFKLYGDLPEGLEVKVESQVIGSQPFQTEYQPDPSLKPGQEVVQQRGSAGLVSEAYRLVYEHGELVSRELLSRDRYLPTAQVVLQGPPQQPVASAPAPSGSGSVAVAHPEPVTPLQQEQPPADEEPDPGSNGN